MIKAVLIVVCLISLYVAWSMINYAKQVKENERHNNRVTQCSKEKTCKSDSNTEVSEDQVSNKRKYNNAKKKAIESKVKKNAGRNKKKV